MQMNENIKKIINNILGQYPGSEYIPRHSKGIISRNNTFKDGIYLVWDIQSGMRDDPTKLILFEKQTHKTQLG
jgi:hypothetical protein